MGRELKLDNMGLVIGRFGKKGKCKRNWLDQGERERNRGSPGYC